MFSYNSVVDLKMKQTSLVILQQNVYPCSAVLVKVLHTRVCHSSQMMMWAAFLPMLCVFQH